MHKEILTKQQTELLPIVKSFAKDFYLVGGTAIALQIGHRRSIDFDLFTDKNFGNLAIKNKVSKQIKINRQLYTETNQLNLIVNEVKITFFKYLFNIQCAEKLDDIIKMPDLLTLSAMKAYALGMRAKWKDYVDLYFILKNFYSLDDINKKAKSVFKQEFNEKIFRTQLSYFKDVDYQEQVIYLPGMAVDDKKIRNFLKKVSLE
ncbi:MAG: nucleotidyl transferase AbiEii/AbiGii toxin family protein [Patescibacteria group bacterium]